MFSLGVKRGYVIAPWWMFSGISITAAIPVWLLVEGEGFGGDDDQVSDEEEVEEDEHFLREEVLEGEAEAGGELGPQVVPSRTQPEEEEEEEYGGIGPLTRTTTMSSALTLGSNEYSTPTASREPSWVDGGGPSRQTSRQNSRAEASSRAEGQPTMTRRNSVRVMRRTSIPFGMGSVSRRYSSNLGASLGSAGSYHG